MKVAPLYHALKTESWAKPTIVHTGQHYDPNMSDSFFQDLGLPKPDIYLGVGSGSHAEQTAKVLIAYESFLSKLRPDLVIVVGDVNSTMAAALAAAKVVYPTTHSGTHTIQSNSSSLRRPFIAHLEAGLRSFDRNMPEEINRLLTDALADILWVPSKDAIENLVREGIPDSKIQFVGNIMIDSLEMLRPKIEAEQANRTLGLQHGGYGVVTLHRPSNVDNPDTLKELCQSLLDISRHIPLVFPVHPRTRKNLEETGLMATVARSGSLFTPDPLNYISFMSLVFNCRLVITDSGGLQEETSYLGIPCLTVRKNTERPITITNGTNQLCELGQLEHQAITITHKQAGSPNQIQFWDGRTAGRIVKTLAALNTGID